MPQPCHPDRSPAPAAPGAAHSRMVQRIRRRYEQDRHLLAAGAPAAADLLACLAALQPRYPELGARLRVLRQLVLERLAVLDCEQGASLGTVVGTMTALAELALDQACEHAFVQLDALYGAPLAGMGQRAQMWIVGMGKLGARELNVSSDVDLVYLYSHDGHTRGGRKGTIANRHYFQQAARRIYQLIGATTEHGFVFRMDLALRPNGKDGALVCSLDALQEYLLLHGREWERFAWLRSRVVAPQAAIDNGSARALRGVVLPFVFRKYLDYDVFESLRGLHDQIRSHVRERDGLRPGRSNDVKLGRGGIRELEFAVQLPQLVRGGQFPELRTRSTLVALQRLADADLLDAETAAQLASAYTLLRRVEHRIQYLDDRQTHSLPADAADRAWIAATLGLADTAALQDALSRCREQVAGQFDELLSSPDTTRPRDIAAPPQGKALPAAHDLASVRASITNMAFHARLQEWNEQSGLDELPPRLQLRLADLLLRTNGWLLQGRTHETAVVRFVDWLDSLLGRQNYLALLLERPIVHERVLHVLGTARWPARYLLRHPAVIDELADDDLLSARFSSADLVLELEQRRQALQRTGEDSEENLLNLLRRAQHAEVFRTLVRDLERRLSVEEVADDLSALADAILSVSVRWCWPLLRQRHRPEPRMGIIAYGKLGGKELGYGSDLDLVFVFDDDDARAPQIYAAFVRKLILWLTTKTAEGDLYPVDTALRPNGNAGLLVSRFDAYADYQQQRGSNTAWTWEHQAMTRARMLPPCLLPAPDGRPPAASFDLRPAFDAVRHAVIAAARNLVALRREITQMREKIRAAHPVRAGRFDVKHSPGGMVDVEFVTQYLVLAYSRDHPELEPNLGNITLLVRAENAGLLPPGMGLAAAGAYRTLRHVQHRARLDERPTQVAPHSLAPEQRAIHRLWTGVFGARP